MERLILHGGAGRISPEHAREVEAALARAWEAGRAGFGSALDAVEAAIRSMEASAVFDAGRGSILNLQGNVEMDAALMTSDRRVGAAANLTRVGHPITVARRVMELTPHVFLAGEGAQAFARAVGLEEPWEPTRLRRESYRRLREELAKVHPDPATLRRLPWLPQMRGLVERYPELLHGTVGAVALDAKGRLAAGTSTGGIFLKLPGRLSDSCVPGCGTYADERIGISCTGEGEVIIRHTLGSEVARRARGSRSGPSGACAAALRPLPANSVGLIALDRRGRFGHARNTPNLALAHDPPRGSVPVVSTA